MLQKFNSSARKTFFLLSFLSCGIISVGTGCASGGFKLTRQYAGWVNSQQLILRIVLYLLTGIVFAVTLLIDAVVFNTMDFWEGRVSQGQFEFKDGDRTFQVRHEIQPKTQLKKSTIQVFDSKNLLVQTVLLSQTENDEIEMFVDGILKSKVKNLQTLPMAEIFNADGSLAKSEWIPFSQIQTSMRR